MGGGEYRRVDGKRRPGEPQATEGMLNWRVGEKGGRTESIKKKQEQLAP